MSHYSVAVFSREGQDIDELLAPYNENLEVEPYLLYTYADAVKYAREHYTVDGKSDKECWKLIAAGYKTDENGNIFSTYNPKSKWDWWTVGGRFSNTLRTTDGKPVDEGRVGDIVFPYDGAAHARAIRFWEVIVEGQPQGPDENIQSLFKPSYYLDIYKTKELYAKCVAGFSTYAVVTPDGDWLSPGEMGWWGCSSESPEQKLAWELNYKNNILRNLDPSLYVTIVDCHI